MEGNPRLWRKDALLVTASDDDSGKVCKPQHLVMGMHPADTPAVECSTEAVTQSQTREGKGGKTSLGQAN